MQPPPTVPPGGPGGGDDAAIQRHLVSFKSLWAMAAANLSAMQLAQLSDAIEDHMNGLDVISPASPSRGMET